MAEPAGMNYEAVREINLNGVRAYNPGDPVHVSQVEGDGAWLRAGDDVRARPGARIDEPPRNATQGRWAEYAVSQGADRGEAEGLARDELATRYGTPPPLTEKAPKAPAAPAAGKEKEAT
jgi:hypothetical protein